MFQQDISTLVKEIGNMSQMTDKERSKSYFKSINRIVGHLQKQHKLVNEGQYLGMWMGIGTAIGVAIGAAIGIVGAGIPIGVGLGVAMGAALDAKAKKEGRIICPKENASSPQKSKALIIGLGVLVLGGLVAFLLVSRSAYLW
jgi:hypothetical protein